MLGVFIPTNALVKNTKVTQLSSMLKQKIVKKNVQSAATVIWSRMVFAYVTLLVFRSVARR